MEETKSVETELTNMKFADDLLSTQLRSTLIKISQNQIKFFYSLDKVCDIESLSNGNIDDKQKAFWKQVIEDYKLYLIRLSNDPYSSWSKMQISIHLELVWRVHLLNPSKYYTDCRQLFGKIIHHKCKSNIYFNKEHDSDQFLKDFKFKQDELDKVQQFEDDFLRINDISRQTKFIGKILEIHSNKKQITLPLLQHAVNRYERFLQIVIYKEKNNISDWIVPTLDIDLIWHSHQLDTFEYHLFCKHENEGVMITHNDNLDENILSSSTNNTQITWNKTFGANSYLNDRAFSLNNGINTNVNKQYIAAKQKVFCFLILVGMILSVIIAIIIELILFTNDKLMVRISIYIIIITVFGLIAWASRQNVSNIDAICGNITTSRTVRYTATNRKSNNYGYGYDVNNDYGTAYGFNTGGDKGGGGGCDGADYGGGCDAGCGGAGCGGGGCGGGGA